MDVTTTSNQQESATTTTKDVGSVEITPGIQLEKDGDVVIKPGFWISLFKKHKGIIVLVSLLAGSAGIGGSAISQFIAIPDKIVKIESANATEHTTIKKEVKDLAVNLKGEVKDLSNNLKDNVSNLEARLESVKLLQCWLIQQGKKEVPSEVLKICLH